MARQSRHSVVRGKAGGPMPPIDAPRVMSTCECEEVYLGRKVGADGKYHDITQVVYNPECPQHGQIGIS